MAPTNFVYANFPRLASQVEDPGEDIPDVEIPEEPYEDTFSRPILECQLHISINCCSKCKQTAECTK